MPLPLAAASYSYHELQQRPSALLPSLPSPPDLNSHYITHSPLHVHTLASYNRTAGTMAPTYRPYAAEHWRSDAVVAYGAGKPARWASSSSTSAWFLGDPEMKRRGRVASYKAYAVEGKVKASIRRGMRWIKAKCFRVVHR